MTEDARNLSAYRLEKAHDLLEQAELLFHDQRYDGSILFKKLQTNRNNLFKER